MQDQRAYLKVKIKSLAQEARIIREEERKPHSDINEFGYSAKRTGLYNHRVGPVRRETRAALLAYGFIRGRKYRQIEVKNDSEPDWEAVQRMVVKYSLQGYSGKFWRRGEVDAAKKELIERLTDWIGEGLSKKADW